MFNKNIEEWKNNPQNFKSINFSNTIRKYLLEKYNNKCQKCGWSEINPFTNKVPLHVHHKDGDCTNNNEDNLELLCPNCHSLTENFGSLNKKSKRYKK